MEVLENWRVLLYYPLGMLPSVFFFLRFFIQWIKSEQRKESFVDQNFWILSILGNSLASIHYFIQLQYFFLIIQVSNLGIACRNINLMNKNKKPYSTKATIMMLTTSIITISLLFLLQKYLFFNHLDYFTSPIGKNQTEKILHLSFWWQTLGMIGSLLFASRFWYQWWKIERNRENQFDGIFWKLSLYGNLLILIYSFAIQDTVSILNYSFGMIPYGRNLILLHRKAKGTSRST